MLKKRSILSVMVCVSLMASAENYIQTGLVMENETSGTSQVPFPTEVSYLTFEVAAMTETPDALSLYERTENSEKALVGYVRTDGDKVYFYNEETTGGEWRLLYDFGLQPGESCSVYRDRFTSTDHMGEVRCVSRGEDARYGGFPAMNMQEIYGEYTIDSTWLIGLGSTGGFLDRYTGMDGTGCVMLNATLDGTEICRFDTQGVAMPATKDAEQEVIYDLSGRKVLHPQPGMLIISKRGKRIFK